MYLAFATPKGRAAPGSNNVINGYSFIAYTVDADGAYERVSHRVAWSSSNEAIVQPQSGVTSAGTKIYLARSPGNADVIATFEGLQATAPLLVVGSDVLSRTPRIDLTWAGQNTIGALSKASAIMRPPNQDVSNGASWMSSDPAVATVGEGGRITAVSSGTTLITANVNGLVDWFWLSVLPPS